MALLELVSGYAHRVNPNTAIIDIRTHPLAEPLVILPFPMAFLPLAGVLYVWI